MPMMMTMTMILMILICQIKLQFSRVVHLFHSLRSFHAFTPLGQSRKYDLNSRVTRDYAISEQLGTTGHNPSTPGTDITHKSAFNIKPSVKMERNIMSDIGAGNAGVYIFVFITPRDGASTTRAPQAPILLTNPCSILHLR